MRYGNSGFELDCSHGDIGIVVGVTMVVVLTALLCAPAKLVAQAGDDFFKKDPNYAKYGEIGDPQPADSTESIFFEGGQPAGCTISFTSPNEPGKRPNWPCAMKCTGPAAKEAIKSASDVCLNRTKPNGSYRNFYAAGEFKAAQDLTTGQPFETPAGATVCATQTGMEDYPNGKAIKFAPKGDPFCGGVHGDPHLTTLDQRNFDLQPAGEFIMAKSLDDEFEIQVRMEPFSTMISFATAVAARVGPHRIMISADPTAPLLIDGTTFELADGYRLPINGGYASVVRDQNRYTVVWPDGSNLHVDVFNYLLNLWVLPAERLDGSISGLLGNADGDADNDFRTRDGTLLGASPDFETLHGQFADSWRISAEESLFYYADGESTETFTQRDFPDRLITVDDLDPVVRREAEARCRVAGVTEPEALAHCIFDFGFTGNEDYITAALSLQTPPELAAQIAHAEGFPQPEPKVRIDAPKEAFAAHGLEISISGPVQAGYMLGFAPAGSANDGRAANPYSETVVRAGDQVVKLTVPTLPGDYELRYREVQGEGTVLHRQPFRSLAPNLTILAPDVAETGSYIDVKISGDVGESMTLVIEPADSPVLTGGPSYGLRQGAESGGSIHLYNTKPGEYEIRCMSTGGVGTQIYATRKLTIQ